MKEHPYFAGMMAAAMGIPFPMAHDAYQPDGITAGRDFTEGFATGHYVVTYSNEESER